MAQILYFGRRYGEALAQGGWFPSLRPPSGDRQLLIHAHATADLDPMIASLAAGSHEAADRDREWR